ncbi:hypothetical protein [Brenneria corticis]|uniref:Uncharacterized protein n=1 Tax=Brenneria corticis TaxID=2173106 RepID=A0A2U1TMH5_9GAMM|nr:hypothetical protein [Brenneria sp. CFCC 11842]PWC10532.1 hypothetical protein DDT56_21715 [Brenneria sp. CFCC 11842]
MNDEFMILSKIDVAERQLNQSIRLFFEEDDPVSIRTLAEAVGAVLSTISPYKGIIRDKTIPHPMSYRDWLNKNFEPRNFFKHADNDAEETLDFNPKGNELVLLEAVMMFNQLKQDWTPETKVYYCWCLLNHPDLWDEETEDMLYIKGLGLQVNNSKKFYSKFIDDVKEGRRTL